MALPSLAAIAKAIWTAPRVKCRAGASRRGTTGAVPSDATLVDDITRAGRRHGHCTSSDRLVERSTSALVMEDAGEGISQTFVGNGKKVDMSVNSGVLRVVGNNCFVTITRNEGQIMVTGNKGHLQVTENAGCISYTGNHGLIEVGPTTKGIGRVVYTGNGGSVKRMKNGVGGKCGVGGSSTKNPPASKKEDGHQTRKADLQSEGKVKGVPECINSESKKDVHRGVTKENINPEKLQSKSTKPVGSCLQESRKVWLQTSSKNGEQKNGGLKVLHRRNIRVANLSDTELRNWCVNLATELFPM